jgi:hypothetical protein
MSGDPERVRGRKYHQPSPNTPKGLNLASEFMAATDRVGEAEDGTGGRRPPSTMIDARY